MNGGAIAVPYLLSTRTANVGHHFHQNQSHVITNPTPLPIPTPPTFWRKQVTVQQPRDELAWRLFTWKASFIHFIMHPHPHICIRNHFSIKWIDNYLKPTGRDRYTRNRSRSDGLKRTRHPPWNPVTSFGCGAKTCSTIIMSVYKKSGNACNTVSPNATEGLVFFPRSLSINQKPWSSYIELRRR